jgi:hypothetical protein
MKNLGMWILAVGVFLASPVRADIINELVKVECNKDLNYLSIETLDINGRLPMDFINSQPKLLWERYGLIDVHNQLLEFNKIKSRQRGKTVEKQCELLKKGAEDKLEKTTYTIKITGYIYNINPEGRCGGANSVSVTLQDADKILVNDLVFIPSCSDPDSISGIQVLPHEGYFTISGSVGGSYWFSELKAPLDNKTIWEHPQKP